MAFLDNEGNRKYMKNQNGLTTKWINWKQGQYSGNYI